MYACRRSFSALRGDAFSTRPSLTIIGSTQLPMSFSSMYELPYNAFHALKTWYKTGHNSLAINISIVLSIDVVRNLFGGVEQIEQHFFLYGLYKYTRETAAFGGISLTLRGNAAFGVAFGKKIRLAPHWGRQNQPPSHMFPKDYHLIWKRLFTPAFISFRCVHLGAEWSIWAVFPYIFF